MVNAAPFYMKQSEEYIKNHKELSFALYCNLSNLDMGIPDLDSILKHCGFDNDFITTNRKSLEAGNKQSTFFYVPSFISNKEQVEEFEKTFDLIILREEYRSLNLQAHRSNLLLLILLLHDYCFLDAYGDPLYKIECEKPFHDRSYDELPTITQDLIKGKETAILLDILLDIRKPNKTLHIQMGANHALIKIPGLRNKIADNIEATLLESKYDELGAGMALVVEYINYQQTGNDSSLKQSIKKMKTAKKTSPSPLFNKAISSFSLMVRNYLVHNGIPNTLPLMPEDLLNFIEDLFGLFNIEYSPYTRKSVASRKILRKTVSDYIKGN